METNNSDNMPLREDREDALPRVTDYAWSINNDNNNELTSSHSPCK